MSRSDQKTLRDAYRKACGYLHNGRGETLDSDGNIIHRYQSEGVMRYVVERASQFKTSPLSLQDREKIHSDAEIHVQTEAVKQLNSDVSFFKRSEASAKSESERATLAAQKAADESESAIAEYKRLVEAMRAAELKMRNAFFSKNSAEERAKTLLDRYTKSSAEVSSVQQQANRAAEQLKKLQSGSS